MKCDKPSAVYRNRLLRYSDEVWLIWSNKWGCWYRDNCQGYTDDIAKAGLYDRATAAAHYIDPKYPKSYRDIEPFPLSTVRAMLLLRREQIAREACQAVARIDATLTERLAA
jgi:hypothetical protein